MRRPSETELKPSNRRLEGFSDGVFAIVITIMVLDVRIPAGLAFAQDPPAMAQLGSALAAYALSFLVIANLWTSHHYLVFTIDMPARTTLWLNTFLLFWITMIPSAARFLGQFPNSPKAAAAYGLVASGCTAAFMLLRTHAAHSTRNELHRGIHRRVLRRTWLILAIYAVSIPLAFVSPILAWICFVIVPPMLFLPVIRVDTAMPTSDRAMARSCP